MPANYQMLDPEELKTLAREVNQSIRAVVAMADMLREELYLAARKQKAAKPSKKKSRAQCGARRASGGLCTIALEPGQFWCPLHAEERRAKRLRREASMEDKSDIPDDPATPVVTVTTRSEPSKSHEVTADLSPENEGSACARE